MSIYSAAIYEDPSVTAFEPDFSRIRIVRPGSAYQLNAVGVGVFNWARPTISTGPV
jgi:hypothetical protein